MSKALLIAVAVQCLSPQLLGAQGSIETHWSLGGGRSSAFGGDGAGASLGLVHGLYLGSSFLGGVGLDVSWSRPQLAGQRTSGVASRRDLMAVDAHLKSRVLALPGGLAIEAGIPIGVAWSRVGEAGVTEVNPDRPPYNTAGDRRGFMAGGLAALRVPLGDRAWGLVDTKLLRAWVYGGPHWLVVHRLRLELPFE